MNADTIAALERAAELIVNGGIRCQQDAALIRALIETLRAGGERAQIVACNRVDLNDNGGLDEVVTDGAAHLEHLGGKQWFLNCLRADGSSVAVWITGKVTGWEQRDIPLRLRQLDAIAAGAHMRGE